MIPVAAKGQDYEQLRKAILQQQAKTRRKINSIDALINQYQNKLKTTSRKYDEIYSQYKKLKRQLALHKEKISSLKEKQQEILKEIKVTDKKIEHLEDKLHKLISSYKKALRYVYEHGHTSQLALLLSSASIHQMLVRNYYLKKFEKYRKKKEASIKKTEKDLKTSQKERKDAVEENKNVLVSIKKEKKKLLKKTVLQKRNINLLQKNKTKLSEQLSKGKKQKKTLNQTLNHLIAREKNVRKEKKEQQQHIAGNKTEENPSADPPRTIPAGERKGYVGTRGFLSDEQLAAIQQAFAKQKGKLPWPVSGRTVSEHFGRQRNPIYGTVTPNLGIEIVTKPRAPVHVVFNGYVFAVQPVPGYGNVVFVSHGKYKTAYGNLSRVMVRKNTILKKGQLVGYAGSKNSVRGASVFFMLRIGDKNINPETWLKGD
jgi:septal ring factor EnvC (AmiA/AmiB activator)